MRCESCGHENVEGARFCASCGALQAIHGTDEKDPMVGQMIGGRYRVTGVLGEGGMGMVYVGEQQMGSTVRKVAIKTLHPHLSKDPSVLARFHRECGTVAQLEHPNTIKFYDFGATPEGQLYIAMEFVAGRALSEVIEQEAPLPPDRVIKIMRQVCGALDEAHKQGIIHRDLKPENLILTNRAGEADFVKVLDFGIAARTESADAQKEQKLTQQGMVLGTPPYMSPEQFTGKALDTRSDIYSLGVMSYETLTGKLPFDADTPWQWATQHMTVQPVPFEVRAPSANIPAGMRDAILKALHKNRDQRQASAREFFHELSEGARITVEQPSRHESTGTAQMAAAPNFVAAAGGVPTPVNPMAATYPGPGGATPPAMAANIYVPPPPVRSQGGGGKGLIFGLLGVGALLLIAIVVIVARSLKPDEDEQPLANPFNSATSGTATLAPVEPEPVPTVTAPVPSAETAPTASPPPTTGKTKPKPTASGEATTPKPSAEACEACIAAAQSGNITGAAANYKRCSDAAKQAQCKVQINRQAPGAAKTAAFNGHCGQAKAIVSAAEAVGAGTPALTNAVSTCK
jgi:serine/threonine-protein kinase